MYFWYNLPSSILSTKDRSIFASRFLFRQNIVKRLQYYFKSGALEAYIAYIISFEVYSLYPSQPSPLPPRFDLFTDNFSCFGRILLLPHLHSRFQGLDGCQPIPSTDQLAKVSGVVHHAHAVLKSSTSVGSVFGCPQTVL